MGQLYCHICPSNDQFPKKYQDTGQIVQLWHFDPCMEMYIDPNYNLFKFSSNLDFNMEFRKPFVGDNFIYFHFLINGLFCLNH